MSNIDDIRELHELLKSGVLTEEEFAFQKAKLLTENRIDTQTVSLSKNTTNQAGRTTTIGIIVSIATVIMFNPFFSLFGSIFERRLYWSNPFEDGLASLMDPGQNLSYLLNMILCIFAITYLVICFLNKPVFLNQKARAKIISGPKISTLIVSIVLSIWSFPFWNGGTIAYAVKMVSFRESLFKNPMDILILYGDAYLNGGGSGVQLLSLLVSEFIILAYFVLSVINIVLIIRNLRRKS